MKKEREKKSAKQTTGDRMDREEQAIAQLKTRLAKEKSTEAKDNATIEKLMDTMAGAMEGHPTWICALALSHLFSDLLAEAAEDHCPESGMAFHVMMSMFQHIHEVYHDDNE